MYECIRVCTYVCMYVCMYVRTYVCMHICLRICTASLAQWLRPPARERKIQASSPASIVGFFRVESYQ